MRVIAIPFLHAVIPWYTLGVERWNLSDLKILKDFTPFYGVVWCWGSLTSFFGLSQSSSTDMSWRYKCWNTDSWSLWISRQRGQTWGLLPRACCFWSMNSLSTYLTGSHKKLVSLCAVLFKRLKSTGKNKLLVICLTSLFYENWLRTFKVNNVNKKVITVTSICGWHLRSV